MKPEEEPSEEDLKKMADALMQKWTQGSDEDIRGVCKLVLITMAQRNSPVACVIQTLLACWETSPEALERLHATIHGFDAMTQYVQRWHETQENFTPPVAPGYWNLDGPENDDRRMDQDPGNNEPNDADRHGWDEYLN